MFIYTHILHGVSNMFHHMNSSLFLHHCMCFVFNQMKALFAAEYQTKCWQLAWGVVRNANVLLEGRPKRQTKLHTDSANAPTLPIHPSATRNLGPSPHIQFGEHNPSSRISWDELTYGFSGWPRRHNKGQEGRQAKGLLLLLQWVLLAQPKGNSEKLQILNEHRPLMPCDSTVVSPIKSRHP